MTGVTDTQATVKAEDYLPTSGYVFDQNAANVLSGTIAGDNSLVLKVYYKQVFKVTYALVIMVPSNLRPTPYLTEIRLRSSAVIRL